MTDKPTEQVEYRPRISDRSVAAKTGRHWQGWFELLDRIGAAELSHKEIAQHLNDSYGIGGWWSQTVTVEYEKARRLRNKYEKPSGYEISVSKTVYVPVGKLYRICADRSMRVGWLGEEGLELRTTSEERSLCFTWSDGQTVVNVRFYPQDSSKSRVVVQHSKLANLQQAERMKHYWREKLAKLKLSAEREKDF